MNYIQETKHTRPVGYNREIKDAMELFRLDLRALAALLGIEEERCRRELMQEAEMLPIKKMGWLAKIFKRTFDTPGQWEVFIEKRMAERGPDWMEEPPLIEGSTRYYHQLYNQFLRNRQKEAEDE